MSEQKKDFDKNMEGAVWVDTGRTEDWHATHKGSAVIDGVCYYVNAWPVAPEELFDVAEEGQAIRPRITFKFKRKPDDRQNYQPPRKQSASGPVSVQDDNDIPF